MLRRIQRISGVGCFVDCRLAQIQFETMSLIFGENCYGKSTLCDVMRSLAENLPNYVTDRATIPAPDEKTQQIQVSFTLPEQTQETVFSFRGGLWNPPLPDSVRLDVFDTDFIHRNVFTGLSIERPNQENITRFVLGESGVSIAQRISEAKSEIRLLNRNLRGAETGIFAEIDDLPSFLSMDIEQDTTALDDSIASLAHSLERERHLIQDLDAARNRVEPAPCSQIVDLPPLVEQVEELLATTFDQAHQEAEVRLQQHLEGHTQDSGRARNWIQQGITLILGDECPFCGQGILGDTAGLITVYQTIFNDEFDRFVRNTVEGLARAEREFANAACSDISLQIEKNHRALSLYPELLNKPDMLQNFQAADLAATSVMQQLKGWMETHAQLSESLAFLVKRKKESIHVSAQRWGGDANLGQYHVLSSAIESYNASIREIMAGIAGFKESLNTTTLSEAIQRTEIDLKNLRRQKRRIDLNSSCNAYIDTSSQKRSLEEEVTRLLGELEIEQTAFLGRYFGAINRIFSSLGSRRFTISVEQNRRGNLPTINLRVSFNSVPISQDRIRTFFSESDRRALALAIFWAKLETHDEAIQGRTVVVLDDPVTSFDDGRIDRTIRLIEAQLPRLRQVIILSHYPAFLKTFFTRRNGQGEQPLLACLYQNETGTQMRRAIPLDFTETDHQRAYRRIATFIDRQHTEDLFNDLRVFLETEVRSRFHRAICINNLQGLQFANLLDELLRVGAMSPQTRESIEQLRLTLNTDHHIWTHRSQEEKIGIAEDMLRCVYEGL